MSYTPTNWNTGDTITASALNKIENGIANAGSSYDLVIVLNQRVSPSTCTIASGNILDCEDKMSNGEIVNAMLVVLGAWSWVPSGANTSHTTYYLPLVYFDAPYTMLRFGVLFGVNDPARPRDAEAWVSYDADTGAITNYSFTIENL